MRGVASTTRSPERRCGVPGSRLHSLPGYYPTPKRAARRPPGAEPLDRLYADLQLSGREDLNLRPFGPEPNALPGCATPRFFA